MSAGILAGITPRVFGFMLERVVAKREPDFIVGLDSPDGIYLLRWHLTPWRNWIDMLPKERRLLRGFLRLWPNLYLHCFLRSDDDRALHDHPAAAVSWILHRGYVEHTIADGGIIAKQFELRGLDGLLAGSAFGGLGVLQRLPPGDAGDDCDFVGFTVLATGDNDVIRGRSEALAERRFGNRKERCKLREVDMLNHADPNTNKNKTMPEKNRTLSH